MFHNKIVNKFLLVFGSVFFLTSVAVADVKLAVVDLQKVIAESKAGQKAQADFQKETESAQADIDKRKADFDKLREEFQAQASTLSLDARIKKEDELIKKERELKRAVEDQQDSLRRRNNILLGTLLNEIRVVIDGIGRSEKYDLVIEKGSQPLLFSADTIDITTKVVTEFDKANK